MKLPMNLKRCISCGVPLVGPYAGGKEYCQGCTLPGGSMISYEDVLALMTAHLVRTLDLDEAAAQAIAAERLAKLPAWRRRRSRAQGEKQ